MPIRSTPSHLSKRGNRCAVSPGLGPPAPGLPMDGTVPWTPAAFTQHHERQVHPCRVTLCSLDRRAPLPCMPLLPPRTLGRGPGVGPSGLRLLTPRQVCVHTHVHSWLLGTGYWRGALTLGHCRTVPTVARLFALPPARQVPQRLPTLTIFNVCNFHFRLWPNKYETTSHGHFPDGCC